MPITSSSGRVFPDPKNDYEQSLIDENLLYEAMFSKYGFNQSIDRAEFGRSNKDLVRILSNPNVPEERKIALVSQINGYLSSLPNKSFLDQWSEDIIGTSNYMKTMSTASSNIGEAIADVLNTSYEEQYNSATAMAQRENQAGINTDLAGISSQAAGEASNADEQATFSGGPMSGIDYNASFQDFANTAIKGFQLITGFVGQLQQWTGNDIANATNEVLLNEEVRNNIRNSFASVLQREDDLMPSVSELIKSRYSDFTAPGLTAITSRADLDKWVKSYNDSHHESPVDANELLANAVLKEAKKAPNPFTSLRLRKMYERSMSAIHPGSPFVRSFIKELEAKGTKSELENTKDTIQLQELLGGYGQAYRESFQILQDAENEYQKYLKKYYSKRNGKVGFTGFTQDANGNIVESQISDDFVDLEASSEAQSYVADKFNALASSYQARLQKALRKTVDDNLEAIKQKHGEKSLAYSLASIVYPAVCAQLEQDGLKQIGAMFSRPRPSSH